jgi:hypothetical protein
VGEDIFSPIKRNFFMSECVGCGYCCIKTQCDASRRLYGVVDLCPQLSWVEDKKRYVCELMMLPGDLGISYRKQLYAGEGCCSSLNDWRRDVKKRFKIEVSPNYNPLPDYFQVFLKCLAGNFMSSDVMALTLAQMASELKKRDYSQSQIDDLLIHIQRSFSQNRHSFMEDFMG